MEKSRGSSGLAWPALGEEDLEDLEDGAGASLLATASLCLGLSVGMAILRFFRRGVEELKRRTVD